MKTTSLLLEQFKYDKSPIISFQYDPDMPVRLEKAQRIALKYPMLPDEVIDVYDIPLTPNKTLTLHQLISTASNADENFYKYDAGENNMCQTFVENIIDINGLMAN
ncbi:unnamed protein product, partial [Rotaria magnacalcarata]